MIEWPAINFLYKSSSSPSYTDRSGSNQICFRLTPASKWSMPVKYHYLYHYLRHTISYEMMNGFVKFYPAGYHVIKERLFVTKGIRLKDYTLSGLLKILYQDIFNLPCHKSAFGEYFLLINWYSINRDKILNIYIENFLKFKALEQDFFFSISTNWSLAQKLFLNKM